MKLSRILRWIFIISFLIGIGLVIFSRIYFFAALPRLGNSISVLFIIALCSALSLACAQTIEKGRFTKLLWSGIAAAVIAATGWSVVIVFSAFLSDSNKELCINILTPVSLWSALCAISAILLRNRISNWVARVCCSITILSLALVAVIVGIVVWRETSPGNSNNEDLVKPVMYTSIFAVTSLMLTIILTNIKQIQGITEELTIRIEMEVSCPRCELKQSIMTGGASCSRCGLRIKVSIP